MSNYHKYLHKPISRREMLDRCKGGFGALAFMSLFGAIPMACTRSKSGLLSKPDLVVGPTSFA